VGLPADRALVVDFGLAVISVAAAGSALVALAPAGLGAVPLDLALVAVVAG
jgi:hypothetical protein